MDASLALEINKESSKFLFQQTDMFTPDRQSRVYTDSVMFMNENTAGRYGFGLSVTERLCMILCDTTYIICL